MQIEFRDQVVMVTGGARGIGRVIAERFLLEGATVVVLDLPGADLDSVGERFAGGDPGAALAADIRDATAVRRVVDDVVERFGRIDVLVNNAGVNETGSVEDMDPERWDRTFDVNVGGMFRVCQAVIPVLKRQRRGRILNAASFAAIVPSVHSAAYAASKAAVVQFTRVLAGELGPWNITVNSYAPGMVPTAMNGFAELAEARQAELLDLLSLRRWGEAGEIADLLCFLASDHAAYITGSLVDISGGKLATQIPKKAYEAADEAQ
ncbi:SDR family NAD(P)-dependent oxidoreductase [Lysobacter korlensis]|uniref:SDR family NAD(P)-dependent oxidoreductase n=1 Tax=Lysobacter korlensis TaxID=553636 RepID=A0ABV6S0C1_9GAMM